MWWFFGSFMLAALIGLAVYFSFHILKLIGLFVRHIPRVVKILIFFLYILSIPLTFYMTDLGIGWLETATYGFLLTSLYAIFGFLIYDLLHLAAFLQKGRLYGLYQNRKFQKTASFVILGIGLCVTIYGHIHLQRATLQNYTAVVQKKGAGEISAVLVTDLHLGASSGRDFVEKLVGRINRLEPDIVWIAGDVFNNNFDKLEQKEETAELLASIKAEYGVYACLGNHDVDALSVNMLTGSRQPSYAAIADSLSASGIQLLDDKVVLVDGRFYVAGRKDAGMGFSGWDRMPLSGLLAGIDQEKPVFLMDHRPYAVEEAVQEGVDLVLCGHTHNGQVFPGNLLIALTEKYGYGYYKNGNTNIVVSSGIGYWGPAYRIGSSSEIVQIQIKFAD